MCLTLYMPQTDELHVNDRITQVRCALVPCIKYAATFNKKFKHGKIPIHGESNRVRTNQDFNWIRTEFPLPPFKTWTQRCIVNQCS